MEYYACAHVQGYVMYDRGMKKRGETIGDCRLVDWQSDLVINAHLAAICGDNGWCTGVHTEGIEKTTTHLGGRIAAVKKHGGWKQDKKRCVCARVCLDVPLIPDASLHHSVYVGASAGVGHTETELTRRMLFFRTKMFFSVKILQIGNVKAIHHRRGGRAQGGQRKQRAREAICTGGRKGVRYLLQAFIDDVFFSENASWRCVLAHIHGSIALETYDGLVHTTTVST